MPSESLKKAVRKYRDKNIKQCTFDLNLNTDKDIIDHLNQVKNRTGYLKKLIRDDMNKK